MKQPRRATKRTTAPPSPVDTTATALTGIVSSEQTHARNEAPSTTPTRRAATVTAAGRILGGAAALGAIAGLALGGAANAGAAPAPQTPLAANSVAAYGEAIDFGPAASQVFHQPLVAMTATPSGDGYWLTAGDGGVFSYGDAEFHGSTGAIALDEPVVAIAATPTGNGYWLAARDGGVFTFGDAEFEGSAAGVSAHNIVGIAATPTGRGYWLAAQDGGVFTFGDAEFNGSAATFGITSPIVAIAATSDGAGYYLLAQDGGIFAFGDAEFKGSAYATIPNDAVGIATLGSGYVVARASGTVLSYGLKTPRRANPTLAASNVATVGVATTRNGFWTVQGNLAAMVDHMNPFLVCTRAHESSPTAPAHDDGYQAVNPNGRYFGAYQFSQSTWNNTARHAGRPDLVGVNPARASMQDQDAMAWDLFQWQGYAPWENRCRGLR